MPVSLPNTGVSIKPGSVALNPSTADIPAEGVSLLTGLSINGFNPTPPVPGTPGTLQFNVAANSMFLPLIGGFP